MRIATVLALLALAQQPTGWKDPSPHVTRFITVGKDLRLEVLDWGGSGRVVVLLAGGGDTAHVFDDFAPKLARDFHVYGITRRGFGQSGFVPASGADTYGDDVLAVTRALELNRPVLVGHSVGGQELSSVATRYPSRVAGLVYLEAAYPYTVDNGTGPTLDDIQKLRSPQPPPPSESEAASFPALQRCLFRACSASRIRKQSFVSRGRSVPTDAWGRRANFRVRHAHHRHEEIRQYSRACARRLLQALTASAVGSTTTRIPPSADRPPHTPLCPNLSSSVRSRSWNPACRARGS